MSLKTASWCNKTLSAQPASPAEHPKRAEWALVQPSLIHQAEPLMLHDNKATFIAHKIVTTKVAKTTWSSKILKATSMRPKEATLIADNKWSVTTTKASTRTSGTPCRAATTARSWRSSRRQWSTRATNLASRRSKKCRVATKTSPDQRIG